MLVAYVAAIVAMIISGPRSMLFIFLCAANFHFAVVSKKAVAAKGKKALECRGISANKCKSLLCKIKEESLPRSRHPVAAT
jgi:hypothetical protein